MALAVAPVSHAYQPQPAFRRPPRGSMPLIAGLSMLMLIALVIGVLLYHNGQDDAPTVLQPVATTPVADDVPTVEPPPETTAAGPMPQVQKVDALLDRSSSSRAKLNSAIDRVGRCSGVSGALADMREVGDERRAQIAEMRGADLSALANGESLRSNLVTALNHSLDADEAFVAWASPAVSACRNTAARKAAYQRGLSASERAGAAKEAFLAGWNPVATNLGLAGRDRQGI